MKNLIIKLKTITNNLSPNQKILISIGAILIILAFWNNLWGNLKITKNQVSTKIDTTQKEIVLLKTTIDKLQKEIANKQKVTDYDAAGSNTVNVQYLKQHAIEIEKIPKVLTAILNTQKNSNLLLELHNLPEKKITDPTNPNLFVYEYNFIIKFNGDYFSAINYLNYLEQLSWPLFLDTIDYKVTKHPTAEVTLQLHLITTQGGGFVHV